MAEALPTFMQVNLCVCSSISQPAAAPPSQAQLSAEMLSSAGKISAPALPLNIRRANLSLSASPDRFDIAKGDEIAWTILLENDGDGTAYGVVVNVTLGSGLAACRHRFTEKSTELELCISCARPDGADHTQGQSGIYPGQLLQHLSSPLGLWSLPGYQPAIRARGKNRPQKAARPASQPGRGRNRRL